MVVEISDKNKFGPVSSKDMQSPHPPLRNGQIFMKDFHENQFFRFLIFEL